MSTTLAAPAADLDALQERFRGEIITPDHRDYDERRRLFNLMHDKRPAVIARCAGTADVVEAVRFARATGLEIAVRSAGRHMAGFASVDGGLVIDLGAMRSVQVDPRERVAWVQTGANGGDLVAEAQAQGLGGVVGWTAGTGVGGVCLGGGFSMLSRKMGWAAENFLELELVTADGQVRRVTPDDDPDLFWAVRGAAANFGVVTWIKMQLHPMPGQVLAGTIVYPGDQGPDVLRFMNQFARTAPAELSWLGDFSVAPDSPDVPEELRGKVLFTVIPVHMGDDLAQAEEDLRPLLEAHPPVFTDVAPRELLDFMREIDTYIPAIRQWYDGAQIAEMSDAVVDVLAAQLPELEALGPTAFLQTYAFPAASDYQGDNMLPFGYVPGGWGIGTTQFWEDPADDELHQAWSDKVIADLRQAGVASDVTYANILQAPDEDRMRRSYGEVNWKRLTSLKAKYDPENVFHLNHNIPPAT